MTILVQVADPAALLNSIKRLIDRREIETWAYDKDGDFYHTPQQWARKAWLRPQMSGSSLNLKLIQRNDEMLTKAVYGVYHGRFVEMLLTHFEETVGSVQSTARQPTYVP
ncbi:hypothetical protein [Paraburkholderia fungorum]|uniref:hypothetical protein n=1 Tax=Paraburkholderia fungorum TaxID=134537 RepID=UPI001C1F1489|nr:hypothetical protein [Paraburkholderia fungorum]MBU7438722.1 hypothetical protein [Paraburkholderia fungorum]